MAKWISPFQSAFVKGRSITDNILMALEMITHIHKAKRSNSKWYALKVDLQKAYDKLSWNFLEAVLTITRFSQEWIQIMMQCVKIVSYGQYTASFKANRRLRQGDPLSPYLFILCSNVLSCMLPKEESNGGIEGIQFARSSPQISHFMYADDTLLFFKATLDNCTRVNHIIFTFCNLGGLSINRQKSSLIFSSNTHPRHRKIMSKIFKINCQNYQGKYLDFEIVLDKRSYRGKVDVVEKIEQRLASWKSRLLFHAGRITLIKVVNQAILVYIMFVCKIPEKFTNKLDSINYNRGKNCIHLANKYLMCAPKDQGCMRLKRMDIFNEALLSRQRIVSNELLLDSRWINNK